MDKDILKGLKISFGIILGLSVFLGLVYAVGFHSANEILGGTFNGNYTFNGTLDLNGEIKISSSNSSCSPSTEGSLRYNSTANYLEFCNSTSWGQVSTSVTCVLQYWNGGSWVDSSSFTVTTGVSGTTGSTTPSHDGTSGGGGSAHTHSVGSSSSSIRVSCS